MVIEVGILKWLKKKFSYEEVDVFDPEYIDLVSAKAMTYSEYEERNRKLQLLQRLEQIKQRGKK